MKPMTCIMHLYIFLQSTSAACVGSTASSHHPLPPPINTFSSSPPPSHLPEVTTNHLHTLSPSSTSPLPPPSSSNVKQGNGKASDKPYGKTTTTLHSSSSESKLNSFKSVPRSTPQRNSSSSSLHSLRLHNRWGTHSSTAIPRRSSSLGSHHGSARTSPYVSPRSSPHGSRRGSPRNSHHGSPYTSPYHSPRNSLHGSPPPPPASSASPTTVTTKGSVFQYHSPKPMMSSAIRSDKPATPGNLASSKNTTTATPSRVMDASVASTSSKNKKPHSYLSSPPTKSQSSPPHTSTQPPPPAYTPDFESGQVLDQLPFEYSSFLDLPPSAFGNHTTCVYKVYSKLHVAKKERKTTHLTNMYDRYIYVDCVECENWRWWVTCTCTCIWYTNSPHIPGVQTHSKI